MDIIVGILAFIGAAVAFFIMILILNAIKIKNGTVIGITSMIIAVLVFGLLAKVLSNAF